MGSGPGHVSEAILVWLINKYEYAFAIEPGSPI
jgi:hypothetical protein